MSNNKKMYILGDPNDLNYLEIVYSHQIQTARESKLSLRAYKYT